MTQSRDPDRLVHRFLTDGPAELSPRLAQAIRDDIRHTNQRALRRSWRTPSMPRPILIFIVLAAALLLGGAVWLGAGGLAPARPVPTAPPPAAVVAPTSTPAPSASPSAIVGNGEPWLVFETADDQAALIRPDGSDRHTLLPGTDSQVTPDWSPDGSQIAYIRTLVDGAELWVANADGSETRRLTEDMSSCGRTFTCTSMADPRWSPDGSSIVAIRVTNDQSRFVSNTIQVVDVATEAVQDVFTSTKDRLFWPDWSADRKTLVVEVDSYDDVVSDSVPSATTIELLDAAPGSTPAPIPGVPAFAGHPDWRADGDAIVFRTNPFNGDALADPTAGTTIRTVAPDGSGLATVLESGPGERVLRGTSWTPDGTGILYSALDPSDGSAVLRMVDADGSNDRSATGAVTTSGGEPRLRPQP